MLICLDAGHALTGPVGARGNKKKEEVETRKIVEALKNKLIDTGHKVVICSCDKAETASKQLQAITRKENQYKADLFVSIHLNAFNGKANGVETYYISAKGRSYASKVQKELVNSIGWLDRGLKTKSLYVLQHTKAPSILVECGFIDSKKDMDLFNVDKISNAIYKGITGKNYIKKPLETKEEFYRVIAGSYKNRKNAVEMVNKLKEEGITAFLEVKK